MLKAAIIGCGNVAGGYDNQIPEESSITHAGAYHICPETKLVAVSDSDAERLKSFQNKWHIERGYEDFKEMLGEESIDILSLCLPTQYHFSAFRTATEHGIKAIFCEKPLSNDLEEAKQMVSLSEGRVVSVNYFRRWNPSIADIAEKFENGDIGKVKNIMVRYTKGLLVNGSHIVDMLRWFLGEPVEINFIRTVYSDPVDPGIDFSLAFFDDVIVYFINIPYVNYVFIDVDIITDKGRIVIGQRGQILTQYTVDRDSHYHFDILGNHQIQKTQWGNCTTRAVQEIVNCMQHGGKTSCTVEDGYRAMEICQEVRNAQKMQK